MKPLACQYSIIQFVPFVETGEFANIGIALVCPQTGFFEFQLQDRKTKRVTDFFEGLERGHYKRAVAAVQEELGRLRGLLLKDATKANADTVRVLFSGLTQPRETIVRFGAPRVLLSNDPARTLQEKFDHYVNHAFATPEYVEHTMNGRLRELLGRLDLLSPFRPARLGNDVFNARFDFVQTLDDSPAKVIKALNLAHKEASEIAAHGDVWVGKIRRLKHYGEMPAEVLFNVELPQMDDRARFDVSNEILGALRSQSVVVVPGHDTDALRRIEEFAEA